MMREDARSSVMLSVIVPVYNVEKYVGRCLDSILGQTFRDFEVICVDDGSTDGSLDILRQYQQKDKRIKVIHKENGGLVSARKAGVLEAKGVYVACVDSDDWIENNMYEEMVAVAKNTGADIVTSGVSKDFAKHSVIETDDIEKGCYEEEQIKNNILGRLILRDKFFVFGLTCMQWNKLYKRELYTQCQMQVDDAVTVGEDAVCVYLCALNAKKITITDGIYYHYCMRDDSLTGMKNSSSDEKVRVLALKEQLVKISREYVCKSQNLGRQFDFFYKYVLLQCMPDALMCYEDGILYPFGEISIQDKIVVYGAGKGGCSVKEVLQNFHFNIVAWVDKNNKEGTLPPEELSIIKYDKVIIAVLKADFVAQITEELLESGVDADKIISIDVKLLEMNKQL